MYTATRLRLVIPSSVPGVLQFSYTDSADTLFWRELIEQSQPTQIHSEVWQVTSPESVLVKQMEQELKQILVNADIPKPIWIIGHLCHITYRIPSDCKESWYSEIRSSSNDFAIVGECVATFEDLGVTSSWMESGIRSAMKGFHHISAKSDVSPILKNK